MRNLSRRERQVLELIATDRSLKETAGILSISRGAVKSYLYRARVKLEVRSTPAAVVVAITNGWICQPMANMTTGDDSGTL